MEASLKNMESFKRGFEFLKQSWQMALADRDLIKPSFYALLAGFLVSLVTMIPMGLIGFFLGDFGFGRAILYVLGAVLVFVQFIVTYVFSAMTVYLIYGYLAEGDGRMDKAWAVVKRDFWDIASWQPPLRWSRSSRHAEGQSAAGWVRRWATCWGFMDRATYLVLPIMVIEDLNLKDGLKRAAQIVRDNLLLVGISTVGVRAVTGLISFLTGGLGIVLGVGGGSLVCFSLCRNAWAIVIAVVLAILIATPFILVAALISSYTSTAYHTCLYLWARDVERAQQAGQPVSVAAPAPLAAVLN
jgi:hypothetical protein